MGTTVRRLASACTVLMLLGMVGCAPALSGYNGNGVRVVVSNNTRDQLQVLLSAADESMDLGSVPRFLQGRLELDAVRAGSGVVVAVVRPDGARMSTDTIRARTGKVIDIRVAEATQQLRWWVY
jgi:hypothetical protein